MIGTVQKALILSRQTKPTRSSLGVRKKVSYSASVIATRVTSGLKQANPSACQVSHLRVQGHKSTKVDRYYE